MTQQPSTHESLTRANDVKVGSDRSFGFVFTVVFLIIGCFPLLSEEPFVRYWALAIAGGFLTISFVMPRLLAPLNLIWFKFGLLLHKIVSPVIMGLLFFVTVTPMALVMRMLGKDLLNLKIDKSAKSYWISREPSGPEPDSMRNQF